MGVHCDLHFKTSEKLRGDETTSLSSQQRNGSTIRVVSPTPLTTTSSRRGGRGGGGVLSSPTTVFRGDNPRPRFAFRPCGRQAGASQLGLEPEPAPGRNLQPSPAGRSGRARATGEYLLSVHKRKAYLLPLYMADTPHSMQGRLEIRPCYKHTPACLPARATSSTFAVGAVGAVGSDAVTSPVLKVRSAP